MFDTSNRGGSHHADAPRAPPAHGNKRSRSLMPSPASHIISNLSADQIHDDIQPAVARHARVKNPKHQMIKPRNRVHPCGTRRPSLTAALTATSCRHCVDGNPEPAGATVGGKDRSTWASLVRTHLRWAILRLGKTADRLVRTKHRSADPHRIGRTQQESPPDPAAEHRTDRRTSLSHASNPRRRASSRR